MSRPRPQDDPRSVTELVEALIDRDLDDEAVDHARAALHWRGDRETLDAARTLIEHADPHRRERGASILGQLGVTKRTFPDECWTLLERMALHEADQDVIASVGYAMGHLCDPRAVGYLLGWQGHPSATVRHAVVFGLNSFTDAGPEVVDALLGLMRDSDVDVRDWATFAIGHKDDLDAPAIRAALAERLDDSDPDTRQEAIHGLARIGDPRAAHALIRELAEYNVTWLLDHAARYILHREAPYDADYSNADPDELIEKIETFLRDGGDR